MEILPGIHVDREHLRRLDYPFCITAAASAIILLAVFPWRHNVRPQFYFSRISFGSDLFIPSLFDLLITVCILFPAYAIIRLAKGGGWNKYVGFSILPMLALGCRAFDYNVESYEGMRIQFAAITLGVALTILRGMTFRRRDDVWGVVLIIIVSGMYAFGLLTMANSWLDSSKPEIFHVKVLGKRSEKSKDSHFYYLALDKWGRRWINEETSIGKEMWLSVETGGVVKVYSKAGLLGAPWFYLEPYQKTGSKVSIASNETPFPPLAPAGSIYKSLDGERFLKILPDGLMQDEDGVRFRYALSPGASAARPTVLKLGLYQNVAFGASREFRQTKEGLFDAKSGTAYYSESAFRAAQAGKGPMAFVKGGCFDMGEGQGEWEDEDEKDNQVHHVCLSDFDMDKYEVTQGAFKDLMGRNPSVFGPCGLDCPADMVTWEEAREFCSRAGKRLPTEAEWEYAARERGGKVRYGTGEDEIDQASANFGAKVTKPAGGFAPNALGLHDMAGNVSEWTADWYDGDYYGISPKENPKGPAKGRYRVTRGGSWFEKENALRAAVRKYLNPEVRSGHMGFRCVR